MVLVRMRVHIDHVMDLELLRFLLLLGFKRDTPLLVLAVGLL
jgi:hypothetical protein